MALDFPQSPTVDQTYSSGSKTWKWNGTYWIVQNSELQAVGWQGGQGPSGIASAQANLYYLQNLNPFIPKTISVNNTNGNLIIENEDNNKITVYDTTTDQSGYVSGPIGNTTISVRSKQTWTRQSTGYTNYSIVYGVGRWVIGSDSGQIWTSTTGVGWSLYGATGNGFLSTDTITALGYGNGLYLAGGTAGRISTSINGTTWTARTSNLTTSIQSITYGNNLYMATSTGLIISTSTDGITWTSRNTGVTGTSGALNKSAYGGGIYVASSGGVAISISTNTITWTTRPSGLLSTEAIQDLKYLNGRFVAIANFNKIISSTDGITWTITSTLPVSNANSIDYSPNGIYYITGNSNDTVYASTNLTTWYSYTNGTDVDERLIEKVWVAVSAKNNKIIFVSNYYLTFTVDELYNTTLRVYREGDIA